MRYFLAQKTLDWSENRHRLKGGRGEYRGGKHGNRIGLYDRNTGKYVWFRFVENHLTRYGFIVERKGAIPTYWKKTLEGEITPDVPPSLSLCPATTTTSR